MAAKNKFMNAMKMPAIADMFSSEADRQRESGDLVTEVPLSELHPFVNHPFEVRDDEDMYGSKSIIILQRHQGVPTAKRVFSMTDTVLTGDKAAAPWEVTDAIRPLLMQVNSVGSLMDRATEQVVSLSDRANRVLATSIEDSALNWSHPEDQRFILQEVAAQSTLYMICIRLGIPVQEEDFPAFQNVTQFDTSRISLCLGGYVQAAAEPLKSS